MGHLIADILFIVVGVLLILICAKRGFLKSVIHFFKTILAFVFAYLFGSKLGKLICDKWVADPVREWVHGKVEGMYSSAAESLDVEAVTAAFPNFAMNDEVKASLQGLNGSGEELINNATEAIAGPAATVISNVIGYVSVFLISLVLLWIAAAILTKIVEHIGFLNTINTVLGGVLGLLIALTVLFVAASAIKLLAGSSPLYLDSAVVKFFGDSKLLESLKFLNFTTLLRS